MDNVKEKENVTLAELKAIAEQSEKLARDIRMISRSFKKMCSSGLKIEAIVTLVSDSSNVGKPRIRAVFKALELLEANYTVSKLADAAMDSVSKR